MEDITNASKSGNLCVHILYYREKQQLFSVVNGLFFIGVGLIISYLFICYSSNDNINMLSILQIRMQQIKIEIKKKKEGTKEHCGPTLNCQYKPRKKEECNRQTEGETPIKWLLVLCIWLCHLRPLSGESPITGANLKPGMQLRKPVLQC